MITLHEILTEDNQQLIKKAANNLGFNTIDLLITDPVIPWQLSFIVTIDRERGGSSNYTGLLESVLTAILKVSVGIIAQSEVIGGLHRSIVNRGITPCETPVDQIAGKFGKSSLEEVLLTESDPDYRDELKNDLKRAQKIMQERIRKREDLGYSPMGGPLSFYNAPASKQLTHQPNNLARKNMKLLIDEVFKWVANDEDRMKEVEEYFQERKLKIDPKKFEVK